MISAWRIDKAKRSLAESFNGVGAAIAGGRWNHPGTRIVYAAETLSLAAFEKFVHMGDEGRSVLLVSYKIDIPDAVIEAVPLRSLPKDWKDVPAPTLTMDVGTEWATATRSVVLKVPSVVTMGEHNFLLNPLHPEFRRLKIHPPEPFQFDTRVWKA